VPYYYTTTLPAVALSGTANTDTDVMRYLTVSPRPCNITRVIFGTGNAAAQDNQVLVYLQRMSTASTTGTAVVPMPHDPGTQAAVTTPFNAAVTIGTKNANGAALRLSFNSRAMVQWVALNPDEAIFLATAGGANGNIDVIGQEGAAVAVSLVGSVTHWE
jgi:hypothetical protein